MPLNRVGRCAFLQREAALTRHMQEEDQVQPAASGRPIGTIEVVAWAGIWEGRAFGPWEPKNGVFGNEVELTGSLQQRLVSPS